MAKPALRTTCSSLPCGSFATVCVNRGHPWGLRSCRCSAPHALLEIQSLDWARPGCPQPCEGQEEEQPYGSQAGAHMQQGRPQVAQFSPRPGHLREQALPCGGVVLQQPDAI